MIARQLSFFAPAAVMSAWATVMLHTVVSGHINRLLSPMFRPYVLVAGVVLIVMSALYLALYQSTPEAVSVAPASARLRRMGRWLVLLLPVLVASILSPSAFSSTTLANRPGASGAMPAMGKNGSENISAAQAADPNQPVPMDVTDLVIIGNNPAQMKSFDGRQVRVIGLFANPAGSGPKLVRWLMWCCAADAQPVSVALSGKTDGDWKDQEWIEVTGTARFPSTLGRVVPEIEVDTIKPTVEPDEPYLSP